MHVIFMLYGIKSAVEHLMMDMQAQKFQFKFYKGKKVMKEITIQGSLRLLPFGIYEYVFPKEYLNLVMTTLDFHIEDQRYKIPKAALAILRKMLRAKKIPDFKPEAKLPFIREHVAIIPIGIREDEDITQPDNMPEVGGWTHESI